jgi:hypothetical protein
VWGQKWPRRTIKEEIIAENLVEIKNIRENFSKSSDFICLFAKISVSLQAIEKCNFKARKYYLCANIVFIDKFLLNYAYNIDCRGKTQFYEDRSDCACHSGA